MSEIKVGDRVTVIGVTPNESFEGCKGTIVRAGVFHEWIVDVTFPDGSHDELGYDEFELTATAQPAPAHAAGEGDAPIVAAIRRRVEATHLDYPVSGAVHDVEVMVREYDTLRAQLAATEARLQAAVGALELIGKLDDDYRNGEGKVGINFTLATAFKAAREALQASEKGE